MSNRNKPRVYFCVYFQQGRTGTNGNPRVFHVGLWVEEKSSRGPGHYFHVQYIPPPPPVNRPHDPVGWVYKSSLMRDRERLADRRLSSQLIGRILIGKLPPGVTALDVHNLIGDEATVPLPRDKYNEDCWDWTGWAIREMQRYGWVKNFDFGRRGGRKWADKFYSQAVDWWVRTNKTVLGKVSVADPLGVDGAHCTVM